MASGTQSNPVYYSSGSSSAGRSTSTRTVILHKRPGHEGFGVFIGEDVPSGLYIVTVERNSPAAEANILPGDRVLAVNGQAVSSVSTNQKDMLVKAATNSQSLALTIQSTDLFQTLNIPLTNAGAERTSNNYRPERSLPRQKFHNSMDLESYIKSLFSNENVEILASSNNNEYFLKAHPYSNYSSSYSSLPARSHHSADRNKEHRPRRHHHHRRQRPHPERIFVQSIATQTSFENDNRENTPEKRSATPQSRPKPAQPNAEKSQLKSRVQQQQTQQTAAENKTRQAQKSKSSRAKNGSDFSGLPSSDSDDESSSATPNRDSRRSGKHNSRISHMVDAVTAAVAASKKPAQSNAHEQTAFGGPTSTVKAPVRSPPPRDSVNAPKRGSPAPPSRDSANAPKRESTAPSSRHLSHNTSRESAPRTERPSASSQNRPSPPPYTPTANNYASPRPTADRSSGSEGGYNIPKAETAPRTPVVRPEHSRELRLTRLPEFHGFGFHLQYNKAFYLVQRIEAGSPAERAGLHANDVILAINQESTDAMPHVSFVQIVNNNSEVDFLVQPLEDYLRTHPQPARPQHAARAVVANASQEQDKQKAAFPKPWRS